MKNITDEDLEFYELFKKYNRKELLAFYELFIAYDNNGLIKILKAVYKEKTNKAIEDDFKKSQDEISLELIKNRNSELSDEQLSMLENIIFSAHNLIFESMDFDPEERFDEDYLDYLQTSFDLLFEFIDRENQRRENENYIR